MQDEFDRQVETLLYRAAMNPVVFRDIGVKETSAFLPLSRTIILLYK